MTANSPRYTAPSRALLWSEQVRAMAETVGCLAALPTLTRGAPGDGHSVLVLPGLLANDVSTATLRHVLRARGYRPHAWRLGPNVGPTARITEGLVRRLEEVHRRSGEPVTLVGWSLGGLLARELARRMPGTVRSLITLGTPVRLTVDDEPKSTHAGPIFNAFAPWHTSFLDLRGLEDGECGLGQGVPTTSIYSKRDGFVPWQAALHLPGPLRENVEVTASHLGMCVHPRVIEIILDRLAQPTGAWQPYGGQMSA